eukprot:UN05855
MEGLFIFYDSLYKEDPDSEMAQVWLMERGCFDEQTQQTFAKKYAKEIKIKKSPTKLVKKTTKKKKTRKRKLKLDDDDSESSENDYK